ncbi:hypothetical protein [Treponema endosymbiont of Eucomonympha sp.]|uniref:hypothetical protein n=1 Tax=Treponema endosymbiont of Eucomonympha sp. TaxID=1580831 RepID=UPI001E5C7BFA|nr:hypothetical protein [Treponema endosymbiont of Eucomonympha sp.]
MVTTAMITPLSAKSSVCRFSISQATRFVIILSETVVRKIGFYWNTGNQQIQQRVPQEKRVATTIYHNEPNLGKSLLCSVKISIRKSNTSCRKDRSK